VGERDQGFKVQHKETCRAEEGGHRPSVGTSAVSTRGGEEARIRSSTISQLRLRLTYSWERKKKNPDSVDYKDTCEGGSRGGLQLGSYNMVRVTSRMPTVEVAK